jgi:hypothetical protein
MTGTARFRRVFVLVKYTEDPIPLDTQSFQELVRIKGSFQRQARILFEQRPLRTIFAYVVSYRMPYELVHLATRSWELTIQLIRFVTGS